MRKFYFVECNVHAARFVEVYHTFTKYSIDKYTSQVAFDSPHYIYKYSL